MTDGDDLEAVSAQILDAFTDGTPPPDPAEIAVSDSEEARQVARYFGRHQWRDVDLPFIREYDESADASACLAFMSPGAFRYYLPAFMLLVLTHYDDIGLIADTTVSNLVPLDVDDADVMDYERSRFDGFTIRQRRAVLSFLEYLRTHRGADYSDHTLCRALHFWAKADESSSSG